MSISGAVDPAAVVAALRELDGLTGGEEGARRVAWTAEWRSARAWLRDHLARSGVEVTEDAAGNAWATVAGTSPRTLVIGSHLDSVPNGGWLDGALGVVAGAAILRAFAAGPPPPITIRVVDWADEEGARFGRSLVGSSAASRRLDLDSFRRLRDAEGQSPDAVLGENGVEVDRMLEASRELADACAYLELHIEQGPVLEDLGLPLAAVLGTYGIRRYVAKFTGQAAHAGSTPFALRRDAFLAAANLALAARGAARDKGGLATSGRCVLSPDVVTVIPGVCELAVDLRHADGEALADLAAEVEGLARQAAEAEGVELEWREVWLIEPVAFDDGLVELIEDAAAELAGSRHRMPSGALHDAVEVALAGVPTAMLFVQSLRGLSHAPEEDSTPEHLELGVRALALAVERLVEREAGRP